MATDTTNLSAEISKRRVSYVKRIEADFGELEPEMEPEDGRKWALNHARLVLNKDLDKANRYFESFELTKDSDIFFIRFLKTFLDYQDSPCLYANSKKYISDILKVWPENDLTSFARWPANHTENHDLMQMTIGMFAEKQRGNSVTSHIKEIKQSLTWRFERGWIEWNSPCYQFHYSNPLMVLIDHDFSGELRGIAQNLLNVMLAERAVLGVNGFLGGPAFRCRTADANNSLTARKVAYLEDNRYDAFLPTVWLAFGLGEPRFDFKNSRVKGLEPATVDYASANEPRLKQDEGMFFACSEFIPHPLVIALAEDARTEGPIIYEGRRHLGWPDSDDLWKTQKWIPGTIYYYNTSHVSLGSIHSSGWVCQSRYSNVMFAEDPSQNLRLEMQLKDVPPHKRRYETRGRLVQHKNCLIGQGTLFEDGGITSIPFDSVNIYKVGKGLCAHFELKESYHVLLVSDLDQYAGENEFVTALSLPRMEDGKIYAVTTDGDRIIVDTKDMSIEINGKLRSHPPKMLHDCKLMKSVYGSGKITIYSTEGSVTFGPKI